jgi:hypothetical protein
LFGGVVWLLGFFLVFVLVFVVVVVVFLFEVFAGLGVCLTTFLLRLERRVVVPEPEPPPVLALTPAPALTRVLRNEPRVPSSSCATTATLASAPQTSARITRGMIFL